MGSTKNLSKIQIWNNKTFKNLAKIQMLQVIGIVRPEIIIKIYLINNKMKVRVELNMHPQ
jgi:hypothetical protein